MKKLLIVLCLFSVHAHAEWKNYSCIILGSNFEARLRFDESKRVIQIGNGPIINVSIDSSTINFRYKNENQSIDRQRGIWRFGGPDDHLYCSRTDIKMF